MGVKIGVALMLHWVFGAVLGLILHSLMEIMVKYFKQRMMKIALKTVVKKIWSGALLEIMV